MATSEITGIPWRYSLIGSSLYKVTDRLGAPAGTFPEIIGADGSQANGLRPFPGFEFIQELSGTLVGGDSGDRTVSGFFPVQLRVGDNTYVDGFVYRVVATSSAGGKVANKSSRIFFKWRAPGGVSYETDTAVEAAALDRLDGDQPMNVVVNGGYCYVQVAGAETVMFFLEPPGLAANLQVRVDTGPGEGPTITQHGPPIAATSATSAAVSSNYYDIAGTDGAGGSTLSAAVLFRLGAPGGNEVQEVALTGRPTGGSFTLRYGASTTSVISASATASEVQSALNNLGGISTVSVSGGPGPNTAWVVKFKGQHTGVNEAEMTGDSSGLTGGASPKVNVTTTQEPPAANAKVFTFSFFDTVNTPPTKVTNPLAAVSDMGQYLQKPGNIPTDALFDKFVALKLLSGDSLNYPPSNVPDEKTDSRVLDVGFRRPGAVDTHRRYGLCIQLFDTRTGRYSAMSKVLEVHPIGTGEEPFRSPEFTIQPLTGKNSAGETVTAIYQVAGGYRSAFLALEVVYDTDKFDTLRVYRTKGGLPLGPLHLDSEYALGGFLTTRQTGVTAPFARAFVFLRTPEPQITQQSAFDGAAFINDLDMPRAGAGIMYANTLFVGNIGRVDSDASGMGIIRWSSVVRQSVELFSPLARYVLELPGEEIVRFAKLGPNLIGFSTQNTYVGRKAGIYPIFEPLYDAIGIVGPRAAANVGTSVYIVTPQGFYSLNADRGAEPVTALRSLFVRDWLASQTVVEAAFDAEAKVLCLLNPTRREACLLYWESRRVTLIHDTPFTHVTDGPVPDNAATAGGVQKRAAFIQVVHPTTSTTRFRVFVIDSDRDKSISFTGHPDHASRAIRTLEPRGTEARQVVHTDFTSGTSLLLKNPGLAGSNAATPAARLEGCVLYVAQASDKALIGRKARIAQVSLNTVGSGAHTVTLESADAAQLFGLLADDSLFISPVYVRATGHIPGIVSGEDSASPGTPFEGRNFLRQRKMHATRVALADVSGPPTLTVAGTAGGNGDATTYNRWAAMVFRGNNETPETINGTTRFFPKLPSGSGPDRSIVDGPSINAAAYNAPHGGVRGAAIFPAFETFVTDMDYQALEMVVDGSIEAREREDRP